MKEYLKKLIGTHIEGQGNQVDLGSALPEILKELIDASFVEPVAYVGLKEKRDAGKLIPGSLYRITDYVATTIQGGTRSANHPFDLIVTAVTEKELDAHAIAVPHDGDHYFDGFNLLAWDILYTLDNDDRYVWALTDKVVDASDNVYWRRTFLDKIHECEKFYAYWDVTNSVVVYAKSEIKTLETVQLYDTNFDEDIEIEVTAYVPSNGKGVIYHMVDEFGNERQFDFKGIQFLRDEAWCEDEKHVSWVDDVVNGTIKDWWFYALSWVDENEEVKDLSLVGNNGTLKNDEGRLIGCFDTKIGSVSAYDIYGIEGLFALDRNVMVSSYSYEGGLYYGTYGIQMGASCYDNTFGNDCYDNTFGNGCNDNTFGNDCRYNTFGNNDWGNTFGNSCSGNTFGNSCYYNTFGNDCRYNTFGNYFQNNTFGNDCNNNTFGNNADNVRYINVLNGIQGKTLTVATNVAYCQFVGLETDGTLNVWNPAD